ncbi:MAG: transporter substrate-binding domain-containing protein [Burkholderiales bacterium]|nr:transporter substrate-binding domain-containing protein [Burkholderiales bacterium]
MTDTSSAPIRVGMLFSETGVTSVIETSQRLGTLLAVHEINASSGIHGRELKLVNYDPQSRPASYRQLAERLVVDDGVRVILGCYMSSTRKAVLPVLERWNALLLYPTLYEGFEYSRHVVYTGAAPNQNSVQLAEFMMRSFGSRVFMVGSDYLYPYESNRIMSDLILEGGGEKVGEVYLPLDAQREDFRAVVKRIKSLQPDFIFSTVVGEGTAMLYQAYAEAGLDPARMPIASLTTSEAEVQQMGAQYAAGHITSAPYFQSIDSDVNRRLVESFHRRFGDDKVANQCWEAAYFQTHLLANAMRRVDPGDIEALLRVLPGSEFEAPQGRVRVDEHNHHTYLRPRIGRGDGKGQFEILEEARSWVRPDPYLVSHTLEDWSVRVKLQTA